MTAALVEVAKVLASIAVTLFLTLPGSSLMDLGIEPRSHSESTDAMTPETLVKLDGDPRESRLCIKPCPKLSLADYHLALAGLSLAFDLAETAAELVEHFSSADVASVQSGASSQQSESGSPPQQAESGSPPQQAESGSPSQQSDPDSEKPRPRRRSRAQSLILGSGEVTVAEDEYHRDDLVCIGGTAIVRGEVEGDVVVVGGVLRLSGKVSGDVVGVGSRVYFEDGAHVEGCVTNVAGSLDRARSVEIEGEFVSIAFPNLGRFATGRGVTSYLLFLVFWIVIFSTAIQFLAVLLVAAIAPDRIEGAIAEPRRSWILAFFLGAVVHIFSTIFTLILCILLPVGVAFWIAVHIALWMGRASIYLYVGRGLGRTLLGRDLSYFGSILMGFALFAILGLIPCFGIVFNWMVSATGLGLMLLTRFGGRRPGPAIPPRSPSAPLPSAAP